MQPDFFPVHGWFTSREEVRCGLAAVREGCGAEVAICFAFHECPVFKLTKAEQKAFFHVSLASCSDLILQSALDRAVRKVLEESVEDPREDIARLIDRQRLVASDFKQLLPTVDRVLQEAQSNTAEWRVVRCNAADWLPSSPPQHLRVAVDLICLVRGTGPVPDDVIRQRLSLLANCSLQVAAERLHQLTKAVDTRMDKATAQFETGSGNGAAGNPLARVVEAAAGLLDSDGAHLFVYSRQDLELVRRASHPHDRIAVDRVNVNDQTAADSTVESVLYDVFKKHKIIVLNEEDPDNRQPFGWREEPEGALRPVTLTVPIIERLYGQYHNRVRGMIVFERDLQATGLCRSFTLFDLIKARIIASRLMTALSRARRVEVEQALERVSREMTMPFPSPPLEWDLLVAELDGNLAGAHTAVDRSFNNVPADLLRSCQRLQRLVDLALELFECDFAFLRLLSTNGLKLVLVASTCEVPPELRELPVKVTDQHDKSISALAARAATTVFVVRHGDRWVNEDGGLAPPVVTGDHTKDIQAVLSIPLVSSGRVLGTLTFESRNRFAFHEHRAWTQRLADVAAHVLTAARASTGARVLAMSGLLAVKLHEIKKAVVDLTEASQMAAEQSGTLAVAVRAAVNSLAPVVGGKAHGASDFVYDTTRNDPDWLSALNIGISLPIGELFKAVFRAIQDREGYVCKLPILLNPVSHLLVGSSNIRPTAVALHSVLDNVLRRSKTDGYTYMKNGKKKSIMVLGKPIRLWDSNFVNVIFVGSAIEEDALRVLYQFPYQRPDGYGGPAKPHLGAFIAGASMRGIGGDVFVNVSATQMTTTVQIPVHLEPAR